jgi:hypothetical protein
MINGAEIELLAGGARCRLGSACVADSSRRGFTFVRLRWQRKLAKGANG